MIQLNQKHTGCYYCAAEMPFLFSRYEKSPGRIAAYLDIDTRHQGWPGIPHGGVGITALIELADILAQPCLEYPLYLNFRFGGERLVIGERVLLEIVQNGNVFVGKMQREGGKQPYLTCEITASAPSLFIDESRAIEYLSSQPAANSSPLVMPNFASRIIFTPHTQHLHKYRTFYFREKMDGRVYVQCSLTDCREKDNGIDINRMGEYLHPGAVITILDETLGWASFFASWQGGVTINISAYFPAPITPGGRLYSVGYCERTCGTSQRKIAYSSGGLFEKKDGSKRLIVYANGRWLTKPEYKEKMLKYITSYSP